MLATTLKGPAASTQLPDALGRFGTFGGRFVPETLMDALNQMTEAYAEAKVDPAFQAKLDGYLADYVGRPSPLFHAERLSASAVARRSTSNARTSTTPALTRSTTRWGRSC